VEYDALFKSAVELKVQNDELEAELAVVKSNQERYLNQVLLNMFLSVSEEESINALGSAWYNLESDYWSSYFLFQAYSTLVADCRSNAQEQGWVSQFCDLPVLWEYWLVLSYASSSRDAILSSVSHSELEEFLAYAKADMETTTTLKHRDFYLEQLQAWIDYFETQEAAAD
jgi:hypothetical protein